MPIRRPARRRMMNYAVFPDGREPDPVKDEIQLERQCPRIMTGIRSISRYHVMVGGYPCIMDGEPAVEMVTMTTLTDPIAKCR
jgi:hypothetical protein